MAGAAGDQRPAHQAATMDGMYDTPPQYTLPCAAAACELLRRRAAVWARMKHVGLRGVRGVVWMAERVHVTWFPWFGWKFADHENQVPRIC